METAPAFYPRTLWPYAVDSQYASLEMLNKSNNIICMLQEVKNNYRVDAGTGLCPKIYLYITPERTSPR